MRILIVAAMAVGCGGGQAVVIPDAAVADPVALCGSVPEWPEVPLIISSVDENGTKLVTIDRAHWDQLVDYGIATRTWSQCVAR